MKQRPLFLAFFFFFLLLLAAFFLSKKFFSFSTPSSELVIKTHPSSLEITLNEEKVGQSPWQRQNLSPGFYWVNLSQGEREYWEGTINLSPSGKTLLEASLCCRFFNQISLLNYYQPSSRHTLALTSNPAGVKVFLDKKEIGVTPLVLNLEKERFSLLLKKEGWREWQKDLVLPRGESLILDLSLALDPWANLKTWNWQPDQGKIALADSEIINRSDWGAAPSNCSADSCPEQELKKIKIWQVKLATEQVKVSDWLKGAQFWAQNELHLPDLPFIYVLDEAGQVYQGAENEKWAVAKWLENSSSPLLDLEEGEVPIVVVLPPSLDQVPGAAREKLSELYRRLFPVNEQKSSTKKVTVLNTPTGYLNVRSGPGLNYSLLQRIYPGEVYDWRETQGGWYKIKIGEREGWIYSLYARLE